GTLEQGAGLLNVEGAMRLSWTVRQDLVSPVQVGTSLLTGSVTASSSFASSSFNWSTTIVRKFNVMSGSGLITRFQGSYATGALLGDGFLISDGLLVNKGVLLSGTNQLGSGALVWMSSGFIADGLLLSD